MHTSVTVKRISYIIGSVTFIIIGALHTLTQVTVLSGQEVKVAYRAGGPIDVNGSVIDGWHLFAGTSLLMGFYAVALGLTNLAALYGRPRTEGPPAAVAAVTLAMLVGIAVVGRLHLTSFQAIGGIVGIMLFIGPATARLGRSTDAVDSTDRTPVGC